MPLLHNLSGSSDIYAAYEAGNTHVAVIWAFTIDEIVLIILTVAPLLLVVRPLARMVSGKDREEDEARREYVAKRADAIQTARRHSIAMLEPDLNGLADASQSLEGSLEQRSRQQEEDWDALQRDVAGVAWSLIHLRSTLGAEDAKATFAPVSCNGEASRTRNMSALARARGAAAGKAKAAQGAGTDADAADAPSLRSEADSVGSTKIWIDGKRVEFSTFDALGELPKPVCVRGPSGKLYMGRSLGCLGPGDEPRRLAIRLVESRPFDPLILLTIACNCATMAWQSPLDPEGTEKAALLGTLEWVYLAIFTFELLTKVVAYGFLFGREAYLRDSWCQLDFVVVGLAWLPILIPTMGNFNVIRAVRALRPLRALKRMPGMPKLVGCVLASIPKLANVGALCGFMFLVFGSAPGIVGIELFKGAMHYRCALPGFEPASDASAALSPPYAGARRLGVADDALAALELDAFAATRDGAAQADFDTGEFCAAAGPDSCAEGTRCAYFEANPVEELAPFDDLGWASIVILQCTSFDAWTVGMYVLMEHVSEWVWLYYCLIVVLGGFFVVNLFLAILLEEFLSAAQLEDAEKAAHAIEAENAQERAKERAGRARGEPPSPGRSPHIAPTKEAEAAGCCAEAGCCDCAPAGGWRAALRRLVLADWFGHGSTALVVVNMAVMCMPYAGMSADYADGVEAAGTALTLAFMLEMALKLVGLGCAGYWSDRWNVLDGTIVVISGFDLGLTLLFAGGGPNISFLRILRMLRVLRMLRLMRSWKGLFKVCMTLYKALPQTSNVLILFFLIALIFALLGMQLFGGTFDPAHNGALDAAEPPELPRTHFDYVGPAMLTVFIVMSGSWFDIMMAQAEVEPTAPAYFVAVLVVGTYLLLNIFVTILLESFAQDDEEEEAEAAAGEAGEAGDDAAAAGEGAEADAERAEDEAAEEAGCGGGRSLCCFGREHWLRQLSTWLVSSTKFDLFIVALILASSICLALDTPRLDPYSELARGLGQLNLFFTIAFTLEMCLKIVSLGFVCGRRAYLRDPWNVLDFCIVLISLLVLLSDGIPQLKALRSLRTLRVLRPLRLLARDPGMRLIITTLFKVMPSVLNVFGVMLAIMMIFAILGMQLFMGSFGACTDETITRQELCGVFGAPGRALGAGAALDGGAARRALKGGGGGGGGGVELGEGEAPQWLNPELGSFDSFGSTMLLLYVMSTGDGWEDVMYQAMDAVGPGRAPERNDFSGVSLYFVAWMFFGSFFALNLFVGAICDNFTQMKAESDGSATMTAGQQQWVHTMKEMQTLKAARAQRSPDGAVRRCLFGLVTSQGFDGFIMLVIVANVLLMGGDYWRIGEDAGASAVYDTAMLTFSYIYYAEAALKIGALGRGYFRDGWCRFDFFLVCTTALDQFAAELLAGVLPLPPMLLRVLRVFRILRILRLLKDKRAKGLRDLLMTMVLSFPSLVNVGSLLALLLFMYAVLGVQLFTFVQHGETLSDDRNFDTFGAALLLLFQALTGDEWAALMDACMITPTDSGCSAEAGDCGSAAAIPFFVSFQFLGSFVFLNLVVAVILENFTSLGNVNPELVSSADIATFREVWADFDPDANHLIPADQLPALVMRLQPPLGLKPSGSKFVTHGQAVRFCIKLTRMSSRPNQPAPWLKLVEYEGEVRFQEVLDALVHQNFENRLEEGLPSAETGPPEVQRLLSARSTLRGEDESSEGGTPRRESTALKHFARVVIRDYVRKRRALPGGPADESALPPAEPRSASRDSRKGAELL